MIQYEITLNKRQVDGTVINVNLDALVGHAPLDLLDETLDSYALQVLNKNREAFSMLDTVHVKATLEDAGVVEDTYAIILDDIEVTGRNPLIFLHNIYNGELTKELETYPLPNISFTQPIDGTLRYANLAKLYDRVIDIYNVETNENFLGTRRYSLDPDIRTIMESIEAPQLRIKSPNLRQAINEIFKYMDAVVRLTVGNVITADFFNLAISTKNILDDDIVEYRSTQSFEQYGTALESNAKNVVSDKGIDNPIIKFPVGNAWTSIRSEDVIIDEDLAALNVITPFRVVKKIRVKDKRDNSIHDLSQYVAEENAWTALRTEGFVTGTSNNHKQNTLQYSFQGKQIFGFGKNFRKGFLNLFTTSVWVEAFKSAGISNPEATNLTDFLFQIEYEPIIKDDKLRTYREDLTDINKNVVFTYNQQDQINDFSKFTANISGVIQRAGVKEYELTMIVKNKSDLFNVNTYILNYNAIITKRELIYFKNHIIAKYGLSKEFNRINKFVSVDSKRRETDLPVVNDTIFRNILYEDFCIVNLEGLRNNNSHLTTEGKNSILNTLIGGSGRGVESILFATDESGSMIQAVDAKGGTNLLRFRFEFDSNIFAGKTIIPNLDNGIDQDRDTERGAKYTLDDGTFERISLSYGLTYGNVNNSFDDDEIIGKNIPYAINDFLGNSSLIDIGSFTEEEDFILNIVKEEGETLSSNDNETFSGFLENLFVELIITESAIPVTIPDPFTIEFEFLIDGDEIVRRSIIVDDFNQTSQFKIPINRTVLNNFTYFFTTISIEVGTNYRILTNNLKTVIQVPNVNDSLLIKKDPGEILGFTYNHHILPLNGVNGEVIIGREFCEKNLLVNGLPKNVSVYATGIRYQKFEKINVKKHIPLGDESILTLGPNSITLDPGLLGSNQSWAIGDANDKLLLAVNPPRTVDFSGVAREVIDFSFEHFHPNIIYNLFEPNLPSIPAPPSGLVGIPVSATSIEMTWTDNSNNEDGFTIEIQLDDLGWVDLQVLDPNVTEFTYENLFTNTEYQFRVRAFNGDGNSNYDTAFATTNADVVATPTINEVSKTSSSITINVTNNDALSAEIFADIGINPPTTSRGQIVSLGNTSNITFNGLSANTAYTFYAKGIHILKLDSVVTSKIITTLVTTTTRTPFVVFDTDSTTSSSIRFRVFNDDASQAELKYGVNNNNPGLFISLGNVAGKSYSSYETVGGLNPSTPYTVYANAKASGENTSGIDSNIETTDPLDLPNAPSNLQLNHDGFLELSIDWTDNSDNEDGFRIEISENSGSSWAFLENVGANVESTIATIPSGEGRIDIRVRAFNGDGNSAWISGNITV